MKDSREVADWILREIASVNPYDNKDKHLAFVWACGFLARCCAEMIWRDNFNYTIFNRIRERALEKKKRGPAA